MLNVLMILYISYSACGLLFFQVCSIFGRSQVNKVYDMFFAMILKMFLLIFFACVFVGEWNWYKTSVSDNIHLVPVSSQ